MTTSRANEATAPGQAGALTRPASWQLDPSNSTVTFSHKAIWGLVTVRAEFTDISGTAEILADGSARGRLEIGAATVNTKNRKRDEHLRSADFFHAAAHPAIVVDVTQAQPTDDGSVRVTGTLTVRGETRPLTLTATITQASDEGITLVAQADIDRADFGIRWNQLGMIKGVAHLNVVAKFVR
jgi:polyisoprenoid-binding protein YceI